MVRELAFATVIVAGWLLDGCASHAPVGRRVETRTPTAHVLAAPEDADLRADMEALLREREEFFASEGTVGATSSAPATTRGRTLPRAGAIPTKRVTRVEAMAFNGESGKGPKCTPEGEPFAPGGRLCGDVRLPVATLTDAEMASVFRLLDDAENSYGPKANRNGHYTSRSVVACEFAPHHALAFYDDAGELLGTIAVCMTCHQWLVRPSSPGTGRGEAVLLDEHERTTLASIFNSHGLGAWIFDEDDPRGDEVSAYERAIYGTEADPTPRGITRRRRRLEASSSGVARTKKLAELTRGERDALCTWTTKKVRPGRRNGESHGYECVSGTTWIASYGEKDCGVRSLQCSATVGELEACLRELREPEDLCAPPIAACTGLMQCLPGIVAR